MNCKICTVDGKVSNLLATEILDALNNANNPDGDNRFATIVDLEAIGVGSNIFVVANYSAFPDPTISTGKYYWAESNQGTAWLPGSLGGTYRPKGLYYSNGLEWITVDAPINATQAEVDGGMNDVKFVTPLTLKNNLDILINNQIQSSNYLHDQGIPASTWTIVHNLNKYPSVTVIDSSNREVEGSVTHITLNSLAITFNNPFSGKATMN